MGECILASEHNDKPDLSTHKLSLTMLLYAENVNRMAGDMDTAGRVSVCFLSLINIEWVTGIYAKLWFSVGKNGDMGRFFYRRNTWFRKVA